MTSRLATCSCGQLTATARGEPLRVSICHCLACQKRTGSVFAVQARFPADAVVVEGRARLADAVPDDPDVRLSTDLDTFNRLCCGRGDPVPLIASVRVAGDAELAQRILENINFMV